MNLHLAEIAAIIAPGAHAVLLVDQAGWHISTRLVVPSNITIIALPPKCPELNPVENVWQFMRDNWLSNRIFKSYDDLVDHCCEAWNKLVDQPWRIMSIGLRQWAQRCRPNILRQSAPFAADRGIGALLWAITTIILYLAITELLEELLITS